MCAERDLVDRHLARDWRALEGHNFVWLALNALHTSRMYQRMLRAASASRESGEETCPLLRVVHTNTLGTCPALGVVEARGQSLTRAIVPSIE